MRIVDQIKQWLAYQLGPSYPRVVLIVGRAGGAFVLAFAGKIVGSGLSIGNIVSLSYWETALLAGVLAVLTLAQSLITSWITGHPALLSFVSNTLRRQGQLAKGLPARPRKTVPYLTTTRKDAR